MQVNNARVMTYYTAYLWDLGWDITVESNAAKVFICEGAVKAALDAIQVMGGDGVTPFYPLAAIMKVAKVENIAGGTMEACRLVIYRTGLRQMADEFKMPYRVIHEELGVPVPASGVPEKDKAIDEEKLLMDILKDRRETKLMKLRTDDYLGNFNNSLFGSIFKKAKKESEKEEGDE